MTAEEIKEYIDQYAINMDHLVRKRYVSGLLRMRLVKYLQKNEKYRSFSEDDGKEFMQGIISYLEDCYEGVKESGFTNEF